MLIDENAPNSTKKKQKQKVSCKEAGIQTGQDYLTANNENQINSGRVSS